jgi:hypothetical protein
MNKTLARFFKNETIIAILLVFLTTAITYGSSIPRLGYYYDDWYLLWSGQVRGAASIVSLFSWEIAF